MRPQGLQGGNGACNARLELSSKFKKLVFFGFFPPPPFSLQTSKDWHWGFGAKGIAARDAIVSQQVRSSSTTAQLLQHNCASKPCKQGEVPRKQNLKGTIAFSFVNCCASTRDPFHCKPNTPHLKKSRDSHFGSIIQVFMLELSFLRPDPACNSPREYPLKQT